MFSFLRGIPCLNFCTSRLLLSYEPVNYDFRIVFSCFVSVCYSYMHVSFSWNLTGKVVTTQDLHNLKLNRHGRYEAEQLVQEIEECRQKHQAKIIPIVDKNDELQISFLQTPHMEQAYKSFPEVVLLDATYRTNKLKMPLYVFVVQDGCGESQVIAYAFVASEQSHHVTEILNLFVRENPCSENTGVIVVDKDFTQISALRSTFPSAPSIQLCQVHVVKAFRTAVSHLARSSEERNKMMTTFNEMLHAPNASKFEEARSEFTRFASKESMEYLEKNWLSSKNMWVRHLCDQEFTCGANTTNRVEAHNSFIKTALSSSTKLHDAVRKLLELSSNFERKSAHSAALLKTCVFYNHSSNTKIEEACANVLTPFACGLIRKQFCQLAESDVEVKKTESLYHVTFSNGERWHNISIENHSCSCTFFSKMGLPCRHLFAVYVRYDIEPDLEKAVRRRWFKWYQTTSLPNPHAVAENSTPAEQLRVLSMPGPNFDKMNRNQRYNFTMRTLKALADTLADCQPDIFAQRLRLLEDLNSTWLKGGEEKERDKSIYLATSSDSECDTPAAQNPHVQAAEVGNLLEKAEEPENPVQAVVVENVQEKPQEPNSPGQAIAVESVQEKAEETGKGCAIKLPAVKSKGRPPKRIRQRKINKKREQEGPMPFQDLSTKSQEICKTTTFASFLEVYNHDLQGMQQKHL